MISTADEQRMHNAEKQAFHKGFVKAVSLLFGKARSDGEAEFLERSLAELDLSSEFIHACRANGIELAASVSAYSDDDLCRGSTYYCPGHGCINSSEPCPPE